MGPRERPLLFLASKARNRPTRGYPFLPDRGETQRRLSVCRQLEKPFRDHPARVVVEVHLLNSSDRTVQPGISIRAEPGSMDRASWLNDMSVSR